MLSRYHFYSSAIPKVKSFIASSNPLSIKSIYEWRKLTFELLRYQQSCGALTSCHELKRNYSTERGKEINIATNANSSSFDVRGELEDIDRDGDLEKDLNEYPTPMDEDYGEYTAGHGFENEHLVKLTPLQRAIITVGSGLSAFLDPTRAENIATFGEISAGLVLKRLHKKMLDDPEGYRILTEKPRINSKTVDLDYLAKLPEGTLGWAYIQFLRKNGVTPDSRLPVRFIEDPELAYVMQRYREVHDLVHTVTGQPTNMLGEVVVKWIEGIQTGLPMCVTGGLFGATRLRPKQRQRYVNTHLKWAIDVGFTSKPFLFIFYEERWEQRLEDLQFYICPKLLTPPPEKIAKSQKS